MSKFIVGQEVWLYQDRREPQRHTVSKVGRTNVYIEQYGRERGFKIDTGYQAGNFVGSADRIESDEMRAARERRVSVTEILDAHGFRPKGYGDYKQSTEVLESVLAVLAAQPGEPEST